MACQVCRKKLEDMAEESSTASSSTDESIREYEHILEIEQSRAEVEKILEMEDQSPLKLQGLPSTSRAPYGKRKIEQIRHSIGEKISKVLAVDSEEIVTSDEKFKQLELENASMKKKVNYFDSLMDEMKTKIGGSDMTKAKQVQILTMAPQHWSRQECARYFNVSERLVRNARQLRQTEGICALPPPHKGRPFDEEISKKVAEIFDDPEYVRTMPGRKDHVSLGGKEYAQKKLLLCTLHELYVLFKEKNQDAKLGFIKFCLLRPKWCVSAGASGTHSVCVCIYHQNITLLLHAAGLWEPLAELLALTVCDVQNGDCMLHKCDNCPGGSDLRSVINSQFEDESDDVTFNMWDKQDRTDMGTKSMPVSEFTNLTCKLVLELAPHHYIAKCQSSHLREEKENLPPNKALILMDFSENYSYYIQDEVQGFHWTSNQCTVHPVVCYMAIEGVLTHRSLCFLTEDVKHDVAMVYKMQQHVMSFLKENFANIDCVEYFTDGCAAQYKNCKSFYNLVQHEADFGIKAEWAFFATCHGKSACDGIGGVVKRQVHLESLRRPLERQITSVQKMFECCSTKMPNINFMTIAKSEIDDVRKNLCLRLEKATTIKGTLGYHHFTPITAYSIGMKRTSKDLEFAQTHNFGIPLDPSLEVCEGEYLAIAFEKNWHICIAMEVVNKEEDAFIRFMHPPGRADQYHWPDPIDTDWISFHNVLKHIGAPALIGDKYKISEQDTADIKEKFNVFMNL